MSEISEKGRKLLDQYWDAVIGYERMSGYINYEKAEDMALDELSSYIAALEAEVAALKPYRVDSIVCSSCGRKIGNVAPTEVQE